MKINTSTSAIMTEGSLARKQATIELNPIIAHVLSRDLYERPIEAVIREILINAIDAHKEAGVTRPVELHLPSAFNERFSVRDFGKGLSNDEFMEIYLDYGKSTRRHTNDINGGLGLGTKSPFAYTNAFTVTSYNGGVKREYVIYYDEDGIPTRDLRSEEPTDETGLEVRFTLNNSMDYYDFNVAAKRILPYIPSELYTLVSLFEKDPSVFAPSSLPKGVRLGNHEAIMLELVPGTGAQVIAGYQRYDVDVDQFVAALRRVKVDESIPDFVPSAFFEKLCSKRLVNIYGEIGEFQIHPSRERVLVSRNGIASLTKKLKELYLYLTAKKLPSLEEDLLFHSLTGAPLFPDLKVRARIICMNYRWDRGAISKHISNYTELLTELEAYLEYSPKSDYKQAAFLSGTDLTDYLGNANRGLRVDSSSFTYDERTMYDKKIVMVFDYERTDDSLLGLIRRKCEILSIDDFVEKYRRVQIEKAEYNNSRGFYREYHQRNTVKSFSEPEHNLLRLRTFAQVKNHGHPRNITEQGLQSYRSLGRAKVDWTSFKGNVESLKKEKRPIFWVETFMGLGPEANKVFDDAVYFMSWLEDTKAVPERLRPIIIGLPSSKGTKKIEAVFPHIDEIYKYMEKLGKTTWIKRRWRHYKFRTTIENYFGYQASWQRLESKNTLLTNAAQYSGIVSKVYKHIRNMRRRDKFDLSNEPSYYYNKLTLQACELLGLTEDYGVSLDPFNFHEHSQFVYIFQLFGEAMARYSVFRTEVIPRSGRYYLYDGVQKEHLGPIDTTNSLTLYKNWVKLVSEQLNDLPTGVKIHA
jgi:hypothetical protein